MTARVYSFSPGPAVLPLPVLQEVQRDLVCHPALGVSVLEVGHRTKWFLGVLEETKANLRRLLGLGDDFEIVFLQGGSRLQFSMIPLNFLRGRSLPADYLLTGSWSVMAADEAPREGTVNIAWTGKGENFSRLPRTEEIRLSPQSAYVYYTSNETIQGVQFPREPEAGDRPLVCDASSDFLCRPLDARRHGLIYACAQKNAGPAGVTICIIRRDMLAAIPDGLHSMLDYRSHVKGDSTFNTPPTFAIYVVNLVTRWLLNTIGGLAEMERLNREKAAWLYEVIDRFPKLYQGHAAADCRSLMNVTFRLPDEAREKAFLAGAKERGLHELAGHRSVGGVRASIYNAMPSAGVAALRDYMLEFQKSHG